MLHVGECEIDDAQTAKSLPEYISLCKISVADSADMNEIELREENQPVTASALWILARGHTHSPLNQA